MFNKSFGTPYGGGTGGFDTSLTFGQPSGLFGSRPFTQQPAATATNTGFGFGAATATNTGFGFGVATDTNTGFGFGAATATSTGFGFGSATATNTGFGFGAATDTNTGFRFGAATATSTGFGFGSATATNTGFGFGAATDTNTGFGFGAATATNTGFGFGAATATNTGFGFGAATGTSTSLFGNTGTGASGFLFSQPSNAFGANKPTTFASFGTSTTSGWLFESTNTASNPFGGGGVASLFGGAGFTAAQQQPGTTVKFNPPTGTETRVNAGVTTIINTRHQCITAMKEYKHKFLEELRLDDYQAGRKGPTNPMAAPTGGLFGATAPNTNFSFGQNKTTFGATPAAKGFGATAGGMFGQPAPQPASSLFKPFGQTTTTPSTGFSFRNTNTMGQANTSSMQREQQWEQDIRLCLGTTRANWAPHWERWKPSERLHSTAPSALELHSSQSGLFGNTAAQAQAQAAPQAGDLFGAAQPSTAGSFGAATGLFGQTSPGFGSAGTRVCSAPAPGSSATSPPSRWGPEPTPPPWLSALPRPPGVCLGTSRPPWTWGRHWEPASEQQWEQDIRLRMETARANWAPHWEQWEPSERLHSTPEPAPSALELHSSQSGLFGNTAPPQAGDLFGAAQPSTAASFGAPTGLFGQTSPGFGSVGTQQSLFGTGSGFGNKPALALGSGTNAPPALTDPSGTASQHALLQQQRSILAYSPYGDSPLFRNPLTDPKKKVRLKPTNPTAQKALTTPTHYKLTPRPATRVRPKALSSGASKLQLFNGLDDDEPSLTNGEPRQHKSIKTLVLKNLNSSQYNSPNNKEMDDLASPPEYLQNGHRMCLLSR